MARSLMKKISVLVAVLFFSMSILYYNIDAYIYSGAYDLSNKSWSDVSDKSYELFKEGKYYRSLAINEKALNISESNKDLDQVKQSLSMKASIHKKIGNKIKSTKINQEKINKYGGGLKLGPATEMWFDNVSKIPYLPISFKTLLLFYSFIIFFIVYLSLRLFYRNRTTPETMIHSANSLSILSKIIYNIDRRFFLIIASIIAILLFIYLISVLGEEISLEREELESNTVVAEECLWEPGSCESLIAKGYYYEESENECIELPGGQKGCSNPPFKSNYDCMFNCRKDTSPEVPCKSDNDCWCDIMRAPPSSSWEPKLGPKHLNQSKCCKEMSGYFCPKANRCQRCLPDD